MTILSLQHILFGDIFGINMATSSSFKQGFGNSAVSAAGRFCHLLENPPEVCRYSAIIVLLNALIGVSLRHRVIRLWCDPHNSCLTSELAEAQPR